MNLEQVPSAVLLTLICLLAALGLGVLGVRFQNRMIKQVAVMIGIAPVIGVGLQLGASWFGWKNPRDFRTAYAGPASTEAWVTRTAPFPVTNQDVRHELELTPEIRGGDAPTRPVPMRFKVSSPKGETLAQGEQELAPGK